MENLIEKNTKKVAMICALCEKNNVIGNNGEIPWHIPEDFKIFKELTSGCSIIMGRKTWDSLPKKPLPNRVNIVISSTQREEYEHWACDLKTAIMYAKLLPNSSEYIWLIGGQRVYEEGLELCEELHLSFVHGEFKGDTFFPSIPPDVFEEVEERRKVYNEFTYKVFKRK
ncbi:MAG: dihydrofolate reductase [Nanoarchaeota archaeon]|nr:dihydrofolate reductase [Nanoarchaeota archaeon]